ncbi:MAG: AbrB family transcriptional regulator [Alphaproteobacteria bacterium]
MAADRLPSPASAARAIRRVDYLALLLALAIGAGGGALFAYFRLPLAWMIGAMTFTSAAALAGMRIAVPMGLRNAMVMVLGIMLGSTFDPDMLDRIGDWLLSLSGLAVYLLVSLALGILYLRRVAGYDPATAYFTAAPGGFNEMVMVGGAMGADDRTVALSHSARVMLVVFTVPFLFQMFGALTVPAGGPLGPALADVAAVDWLLLAACLVGAPLAGLARIPAAMLLGPMVLSAAIHLAGLTDAGPPGELIAAAQVVVGAAIGGRFAGIDPRRIGRAMLVAAGLTVLLLAINVGFAVLLNALTGIAIADLILAYSPGGLAEMSLVALALGVDAAFVSTHHIVRIVLVVTVAPGLFLLMRRMAARRARRPDDA